MTDQQPTPEQVQAAAEQFAKQVSDALRPDDDPCQYDHNDLCQTHMHDRPCAVARATELLATLDRAHAAEPDSETIDTGTYQNPDDTTRIPASRAG